MMDVAGLVLPLFGVIFIGALAARLVRLPADALGWMNVFVIYIALPTLFFQLVSRTPVEQLTEWSYVAGVVAATYIVFLTMFAGSLFFTRGNIGESAIMALAAAYGNIGYMGPGIALLALGEEAAVPVALIVCFENIVHFTVMPFLMSLTGRSGRRDAAFVAEVARKVILHPFIIATGLGVAAAASGFSPPAPVERLLDSLARTAAPCALFAMGVMLGLRPLKRMPLAIAPITVLKLIVHPALCYAVLSLIGDLPPLWVSAAVLLAALPTAANVFVVAQQYGVWVERASASILVTTVASVVTVTAILYLIAGADAP